MQAEHVDTEPADHVLAATDDAVGRRVALQHPARAVGDDHTVGDTGEDGVRLALETLGAGRRLSLERDRAVEQEHERHHRRAERDKRG